jgi:hypothetical protein
MRRNFRTIVLGLVTGSLALVGCSSEGGTSDAKLPADAASSPDTFSTKDTSILADVPIADVLSELPDAKAAPEAAVCEQLAGVAQSQVESYLHSTFSSACLFDSDCSFLEPRSLSCFAACGNVVMRTVDVSAVTNATANVCSEYFGAGCPEKRPPCPYARAVCYHGTCAKGGAPGPLDAAVDTGARDLPIDLPIDGGPADGTSDTPISTAGLCTCDTTIHTTQLMQRYVHVPLDCFCASPFGFLCQDFDRASTLCARSDVHDVSAASFGGCTRHYLNVTIGSVAKGRPTYATLKFDGNSFAGANYEADLICNNLPADEVNDTSLGAVTTGYDQIDAGTCGSVHEWNVCESDGGARYDATSQ